MSIDGPPQTVEAEAIYNARNDTFVVRLHNGRVNMMRAPMRVSTFETMMRGMIRAWEGSGRKL